MTERLLHTASTQQHPYLRRVHVRRDTEGRWFWFHNVCRAAKAGIGTFSEALSQAFAHANDAPCPRPAESFATHIAVDCDANSLRASWLCPWCKQYCASHTPCDCCADVEVDDQ